MVDFQNFPEDKESVIVYGKVKISFPQVLSPGDIGLESYISTLPIHNAYPVRYYAPTFEFRGDCAK